MNINAVDDYLSSRDSTQQEMLGHVRAVVKATVPDATEAISYGIPAFKYKGKYLIGYAGFKDHMSLFPGSAPIAELTEQLSKYELSKGTIKFTTDNPIADILLIQIVGICKDTIDASTPSI